MNIEVKRVLGFWSVVVAISYSVLLLYASCTQKPKPEPEYVCELCWSIYSREYQEIPVYNGRLKWPASIEDKEKYRRMREMLKSEVEF